MIATALDSAPAVLAKQICEAIGIDFRDALEAHLLTGFVFSRPDAFLMGRPVPRGAEIIGPWQSWPATECDAWFVWVAVGEISRLITLMPWPLPWIGFYRAGRHRDENTWLPARLLRRIESAHATCAGITQAGRV